jgi:enoyl-CoA hydratase/carnithine racemase
MTTPDKTVIGEYQDIEAEVDARGVMYLSFNHPERLNALTFEMLAEVDDALQQAAANGDVRCLVLQGRGRAFCAGDNIKGQGDLGIDRDPFSRYLELGYVNTIKVIRALPKPVIAKVQGHAMGAGLELALSADIRIVARDATLGIPFIHIDDRPYQDDRDAVHRQAPERRRSARLRHRYRDRRPCRARPAHGRMGGQAR